MHHLFLKNYLKIVQLNASLKTFEMLKRILSLYFERKSKFTANGETGLLCEPTVVLMLC